MFGLVGASSHSLIKTLKTSSLVLYVGGIAVRSAMISVAFAVGYSREKGGAIKIFLFLFLISSLRRACFEQ